MCHRNQGDLSSQLLISSDTSFRVRFSPIIFPSFSYETGGLISNEFFGNMLLMNNEKNAAKQIIQRFGGQSSLGNILGRRQSTVQHWAKTESHSHMRLVG